MTLKNMFTGLAAALAVTSALAWPTKAVTLVVPFPPGGSTDQIARTLATKMQETTGQTFIVDNRAGATGTIGATHLKRSVADGYTLMVASLGPYVIAPHLVRNVAYDAVNDFDYLTVAVQAPNVLLVPASSPYKTVDDLVADLKKNPGKITFASSGNGSSDHLTAELFWQETGTSGVHIPYRGGAPAMNDLLGAQVNASFQNINVAVPHVQAGRVRALATTADNRSPLLPNVPTLAEAGIKGVDVYSWQAVAAPKGLPADVKKRIHESLVNAINDPQIRSRLVDQGFEIVANTPEQFTAFQQKEFARWKQLIETRKITAD